MFLQLCEELVSLFGCIAHSHHSLCLSLVYDVLLSVAACYNRAVLVKVGSKLFFKLVLNIAQAEYKILAFAGLKLDFDIVRSNG